MRVDPQVERRGLLQSAGEREQLLVAERRAQPREDPVRQVGADLERQRVDVDGLEIGEPRLLAASQHRFDLGQPHPQQLHDRGERDLARRGVGREVLEQPAPAQGRVDHVGHDRAVALAEALVLAEELAQLRVGRGARGKDHGERIHDRIELRAREVHRSVMLVADCSTISRFLAAG